MWEHWYNSYHAVHFLQQDPAVEPGLQQCQAIWGHQLDDLRRQAVDEVIEIVRNQAEDTHDWWSNLPEHIRPVYWDPETSHITQIPVFVDLLATFDYPDVETLREELTKGFSITGELNKGVGWLPRADQRCDHLDMDSFRRHNQHYVKKKLTTSHVDPHWQEMLEEFQTELQRGRMSGPYRQPSWWPKETIGLPGYPLLDLAEDDIKVAFCFGIVQSDKVRRCEDLRRSGHNATIVATDTPYHRAIQTFTEIAKEYSRRGKGSMVWTQDLQGAYRQFPVSQPNECFCAIITPRGVVLLRHHAIMFGATAAVWNFNRSDVPLPTHTGGDSMPLC